MKITDKMRHVATTTIFSMDDIVNAKRRYYITDWAIGVYSSYAVTIGASLSGMASRLEKDSCLVDVEWMAALMNDFIITQRKEQP